MEGSMKITSMKVENFLSFGKAEFDFDDAGLVLVEGENQDDESAKSNGSGKSAMIDALVWCLFGTTLRGYENDEVIHRKVGKDCLVMVDLHDGKSVYRVSRARKHTKWKNTLTVSTNGADASGPSNSETQMVVEKLLGCTRRTFLSSVVFGQDRAYRFSSLTDKEQKEILDEVLGVERFAQACSLARSRKSSLEAAAATVHDGLERATEERDAAEAEAKDLYQKGSDFESDRKEKRKIAQEGLRKAKEFINQLGAVDVDKLKAARDKCRRAVTAQEAAVDSENDAITKAKIALGAAKTKRDDLWAHVRRHEDLVGDCPTCGQEINEKKQKTMIAGLRDKHSAVSLAYVKAEEAMKEIETGLVDSKQRLKEARDASIRGEKAYNDGVGAAANLKSWQQRAKDQEARITEMENEQNPYVQLAVKAKAKYEKREKEVKLLAIQLEADEAQVRQAEFWVEAFGTRGLRSLLLDNSLPVLNEEASRVSRAITGGAISIEFSATSDLKSGKTIDRFEVKVDNKHGAGSYFGNSAGERAKVDLCVGLALQRLVASRATAAFNVVFMDEVFDHLDSAAHERVVEVLSELDKASVFVVSHEEDLKAWFPHTLRVVKKGGFSRVEE
jgi:DNA repair exonuclease SbcCD ATPase subunit